MMKAFLFLFAFAGSASAFSQTKLIFHKSHSGGAFNYTASLSGNPSNFGVAPTRQVQNSVLDSVVFLSDTSAIMITSEYCEYRYYDDQATNPEHRSLWKAGRDTVYRHPLFSRQHSLDSIREVLETDYYFRNAIDSTKFIGYDNQQGQRSTVPPVQSPSKRNDLYLVLLFAGLFLLIGMLVPKRVTMG